MPAVETIERMEGSVVSRTDFRVCTDEDRPAFWSLSGMAARRITKAGAAASYAVAWRVEGGRVCVGKLELAGDSIELGGSGVDAEVARLSIAYEDIARVRIGRASSELVNGRRSVVFERAGAPPLLVAALDGLGRVFELGDALAELASRKTEKPSTVVVIVPVRPGSRDEARRLVAAGPPFDVEELRLGRHQVFLSETEAVFLFEGEGAGEAIERLARSPAVWKAALAWKDVVAGRPRLANEEYGWTSGG